MVQVRRIAIATLFVVLGALSTEAQVYSWSISSSSTDPSANTGTIPGFAVAYLWLECATNGISAAEFDIETVGGTVTVVAFSTDGVGVLNAGGATNLLLAIGGCPDTVLLAGSLIVTGLGPGAICIVPSAANGLKVSVDCESIPNVYDINWNGLSYDGFDPCSKGTRCDGPISVEQTSWGSLKGLYR